MAIQQQRNKYLETSVQTASPTQLLLMLYDGAIRYCKLGIEGIKQSKYQEANVNLIKCQDIVKEFMVTLDPDSPIAEQLSHLYEYFIFRLIEANTKKEPESAEEVLGYLLELKETWVQAAKEMNAANKVGVQHG